MDIKYYTVDVFTKEKFQGAQIAVVPKADELSDDKMQKIANEFNLWRTVFILAGANDEPVVRIFNGKREFDFGGHATLAAIFCIAKLGIIDVIEGVNYFELIENNGRVSCAVTIKRGQPIFTQFTTKSKPSYDRFTPRVSELADILSVDETHLESGEYIPMLVATHAPYLIVPMANLDALKKAQFNYNAWAGSTAPSTLANVIVLFCPDDSDSQTNFNCRLVGPVFGMHEDPPIGAAMPAFSGYLTQFKAHKKLPFNYVAERGAYQARKSLLHIETVASDMMGVELNIGGEAVLVSKGTLYC